MDMVIDSGLVRVGSGVVSRALLGSVSWRVLVRVFPLFYWAVPSACASFVLGMSRCMVLT